MKLKKGFVVREVGGKTVAVAVGAMASEFHGMITLNGSGKLIWQALAEETSEQRIVDLILEEYEVSREVAEADVAKFVGALRGAGLLLE